MCLYGLKCSQNAGKLHSESTKISNFLGFKLVQITHVKSWIHPFKGYCGELLEFRLSSHLFLRETTGISQSSTKY